MLLAVRSYLVRFLQRPLLTSAPRPLRALSAGMSPRRLPLAPLPWVCNQLCPLQWKDEAGDILRGEGPHLWNRALLVILQGGALTVTQRVNGGQVLGGVSDTSSTLKTLHFYSTGYRRNHNNHQVDRSCFVHHFFHMNGVSFLPSFHPPSLPSFLFLSLIFPLSLFWY